MGTETGMIPTHVDRPVENMGIRIQPREIDVPEEEPFKNDLLGRKEPAEVLTHLVGSIEGPCVLAIDAAWGAGKTTFLRIWSQHLRNQEFPVVGFNAWETDHSGDPFVALSSELTEGLQEYKDEPLAQKIGETKKAAKEVFRRALPGIIRVTTAGILDVSPLMEKELGQTLASYAKDRLSEYQEAQKSVNTFRSVLQDMAGTLSKSRGNRPLIVVIDELDRCRPSYAVELLEVAKHLFSVENIVFVLAVNRSELGHSINALYGSEFDAEGYLRRFFDVDFRLPEPERDAFIVAMLDAIQINDYFIRTKDRSAVAHDSTVRAWLQGFFGAPDLSLRRVAQAIHRLGLVFASLRSDRISLASATVVALIVRTINSDLYHQFVRGEVSDLKVSNMVFDRPRARDLQKKYGAYFEVILIRGWMEITSSSSSELWQKYKGIVDAEESDRVSEDLDRDYANQVVELLGNSQTGVGFKYAVQRLELLSPDLIEEHTGAASNDASAASP